MNGFCGAFDLSRRYVDFSQLRRIRGALGGGCAFINNEFGILCDGVPKDGQTDSWQPTTVKYNNHLYTSAIVMDRTATGLESSTSSALLEGYLEEGERYLRRLDFSYALALYDGRCGELILRKGYKGDKTLFYTVRDNTMYFSTYLRSLISLHGGNVRVNKDSLEHFIFDSAPSCPSNLFLDIFALGAGEMLICSSFGYDVVSRDGASRDIGVKAQRALPNFAYSKDFDISRILTDTLFIFGYPQFDCYMPSFIKGASNVQTGRAYCCDEALYEEYAEYAMYRAERVGLSFGIDIYPSERCDVRPSARELRMMDRALDTMIGKYIDEIKLLFGDLRIESVTNEKNIPLRIRRKGMMCQTVLWQEHFNVIFC